MELALKYRPANYKYYHMLAPLLAVAHKQGEYEQVCQKIFNDFGETKEPYVADAMAKDCLLLAWSIPDWKVVSRLTEVAVSEPEQPGIHYFEGCKGLGHYRQGDFKSAIAWAQKSLADPAAPPDLEAMSCAVLAMANHQLNQSDDAHTVLARGTDTILTKLPPRGSDDLGLAWQGWIFAQVLMDEAAELIRGSAQSKSPPRPR
jgi:hypothetical protein